MVSVVAISTSACEPNAERPSSGEKQQQEAQARKSAEQQAKVRSLQDQMELEKANPHPRPMGPEADPPTSAEIEALLSSAKASTSGRLKAPKPCTCKKDDPLCDCW